MKLIFTIIMLAFYCLSHFSQAQAVANISILEETSDKQNFFICLNDNCTPQALPKNKPYQFVAQGESVFIITFQHNYQVTNILESAKNINPLILVGYIDRACSFNQTGSWNFLFSTPKAPNTLVCLAPSCTTCGTDLAIQISGSHKSGYFLTWLGGTGDDSEKAIYGPYFYQNGKIIIKQASKVKVESEIIKKKPATETKKQSAIDKLIENQAK